MAIRKNLTCRNNDKISLDKRHKPVIMHYTIEHLIKSGGGNGPVKPGNLQICKVPIPAVRRKMRLNTAQVRAPENPGRFLTHESSDQTVSFLYDGYGLYSIRRKKNEPLLFYIRIRYRRASG